MDSEMQELERARKRVMKDARAGTTARGHRLGRWNCQGGSYERQSTAYCRNALCSASVSVRICVYGEAGVGTAMGHDCPVRYGLAEQRAGRGG